MDSTGKKLTGAERMAAWRRANPERARASVAKCYADPERKERYESKRREWFNKNAEIIRARSRAWNDANGDKPEVKAKRAARGAEWRKEFPDKHRAKESKRRAAKLQRTPCWVWMEEFELIEWAHSFARVREKVLGGSWHVDHFLPLRGKKVSGLHVVENLRVVPQTVNLRKHATMVGERPTFFF